MTAARIANAYGWVGRAKSKMGTIMADQYVEERDGGFYVAGSRVSLASIIFDFQRGDSPETIRQNSATLSLAQVYRAIAFYLDYPSESEAYLSALDKKWKSLERYAQAPTSEMQIASMPPGNLSPR